MVVEKNAEEPGTWQPWKEHYVDIRCDSPQLGALAPDEWSILKHLGIEDKEEPLLGAMTPEGDTRDRKGEPEKQQRKYHGMEPKRTEEPEESSTSTGRRQWD